MGGCSNSMKSISFENKAFKKKIEEEDKRLRSLNLYQLTNEYLDNKIYISDFEKYARILRDNNAN